MKSLEKTPVPGTYRTSCCRSELSLAKEHTLPLCPVCRRSAQWALVVSREPRPGVGTGRRVPPLPEDVILDA